MAHASGATAETYNVRHFWRQMVVNHQRLVAQIFPQIEITRRTLAVGAAQNGTPIGEGDEMIHCAASQGQTFAVLAMIAGTRLTCNAQDRFGKTALHWAAEQGYLGTVLALMEVGACPDSRSFSKVTPLMLAASGGHEHVLRCLLHAGAGAPDRYSQGRNNAEWRSTALHYAAMGGHVGVVTILLDGGFDRGQHNGAGLTAAEVSARAGHPSSPEVTRRLLGCDRGGKLVHEYVNMVVQDVTTVHGLVQGGAFLDWQDNHMGRTPLHRAVYFGHFQILKILLAAGANPNLADNLAVAPLHLVAVKGCTAAAAELLDAGASTYARTRDGYTPLHLAVVNNRIGVAKLLLGVVRASLEIRDMYHGITPLSWAAKLGLTPMVRVLLEVGASTDSRSSTGLTPLHWACRFNRAEIVQCLIETGGDPDAMDNTGAKVDSVVGLGDPPSCTGPQRPPFIPGAVGEMNQGVDQESRARIQSTLKSARQDRTWRRRGWLVVLAKRRDVAMMAGARAAKRPARLSSASGPATSIPVNAETGRAGRDVHQERAWQEDETFNNPCSGWKIEVCSSANESHTSLTYGSFRSGLLRSRLGSTGSSSTSYVPHVTQKKQGHEEIEALLRLAAVEAGIFRHVVRYI